MGVRSALRLLNQTQDGTGNSVYCFAVAQEELEPSTRSCGVISKIELAVDAGKCRGAHAYSTISGAALKKAPLLSQKPPVLKVTQINRRADEVNVCVALREPCGSLVDLCYGAPYCWYTVFAGPCCSKGLFLNAFS
jgi:hypothetical protein